MTSNNPLVSIIIPVYNAEPFITECISSIQAQTMQDFEIIAVNNNSTDNSLDILNQIAREDPRIKVLSAGKNAGEARNEGMGIATGKYLLFLDADDFFAEGMLDTVVSAAEENNTDIVLFGGSRFNNETQELSDKFEFLNTAFLPENKVFSANDCGINLYRITTPAPWSKLFLHKFIKDNNLQFQSLTNSNDLYFTLAAFSTAKRITAVNGSFIRYRTNVKSSLQGSKSREPLCFLSALEELSIYLKNKSLYKQLGPAFELQSLSTIKYNLENNKTPATKLTILDAVAESNLKIQDWVKPDEDDKETHYAAYLYCYVMSALHQREREQSIIAYEKECQNEELAPSSLDTPVAVSVIIPVYNTEEYIAQTINSARDQTLQNVEIICIDDGSTDNSLDILNQEAKKDNRIKVFTQSNSGLSVTRNRGMQEASGEYIVFLDSDDMLDPEALSSIFTTAKENDLDMLMFDAESFFETEELRSTHASYSSYYTRSQSYSNVYKGYDLLNTLVNNGDYLPSACLYAARKDFLSDINASFIPHIIHEDNSFTFELLLKANRVSHTKQPFYKRRVRENSIMTQTYTFSHCYGYFVCAHRMLTVANTNSEYISEEAYAAALNLAYSAFVNAQKEFNALGLGEEGGTNGLTALEHASFDKLVGTSSAGYRNYKTLTTKLQRANKEKKKQESTIKSKNAEIRKIKGSWRWKIGGVFTYLPRKVKRALKKVLGTLTTPLLLI